MADQFINTIMKSAVGVLCQSIGWHSAQTTTVDILADLMKRHFLQIAKTSHRYAEHVGRTQVNFDDAVLAFRDMGISIPELEEYVQSFDPVTIPFHKDVPNFPVAKESHLNFLRPGSQEVLTRPVHVHEYMPPMIFIEEKELPSKEKEKKEPLPSKEKEKEIKDVNGVVENVDNIQLDPASPLGAEVIVPNADKETPDTIIIDESKGSGNINDDVVAIEEGSDKESDIDPDMPGTPPPSGIGFSAFSNLTPKSAKRLESPGENPALKRVRLMLEEEGHPLREISSVMMTTSGFLSSSREGRLPDTKPPPNRDFFEPLPVPPVEKKKKIPTMKKIVEGVKKIEKENQSEKAAESTFSLFEKPDKITISTSSASTAVANVAANEVAEADTKVSVKGKKEKKVKPTKLTKPAKPAKPAKVSKLADKLVKKASKTHDKEKQKLKIFKKVIPKQDDKPLKPLKKSRKLKLKKDFSSKLAAAALSSVDNGLDNIESDEDFGADSVPATPIAASMSVSVIPVMPGKKQRKKRDKLVILKERKRKFLTPAIVPISKISPLLKKDALFEVPPEVKNIPLNTTATLIGAQKKKRGRPKKAPVGPGIGLGILGEPPLKIMKIRKEHMEPEMKSLIPDISINVKAPLAPPNFDMLMRLPAQPGLIPTSFITPSQPSRASNQLPPSISITPTAPLTPSTPKESRSQQFANLPPSVCSSVTITRIDMSNSQKLPTPFDNSVTPGIGSPNLSGVSTSSTKVSSSSIPIPIQADSSSGITITPIVMDKPDVKSSEKFIEKEKVDKKDKSNSVLAKLEENMKTKEQKKKEKERKKELKKEKKKEKKEKEKEKYKEKEKKEKTEKPEKPEKKDKKEKSEKKKKKEKGKEVVKAVPTIAAAVVPKLTLKLSHSQTPTPVDSPNPPLITIGGSSVEDGPPLTRKITIKAPKAETIIEEMIKRRTPSPELARFSPLVTRPPKATRVGLPTKSPTVPAAVVASTSNEVVSFPPAMASGGAAAKRGPGRPPKSGRGPGRPPKSSQAGLITETVGFYIDDQGNKVWICPSCGRQDDGSPMIGCDTCDDWYHFTCVGIVDTPDEQESWYCHRCTKKKKSALNSTFDHKKKVPKL